jgi:ABC-type xylose transport system substrate-binding protein
VIAALIVAKEKMLRKMSNRDFFINFENKKLGRRLSDSLVPFLGSAKNRYTDKYTEKSMP